MLVPMDCIFTKDHEWARVEEDDIVTIGISDFAQEQLGDIVYLELPEEGDELKKGDSFGTVESTKAASDLYAPVSGEVVEVNEALVDAPGTINDDAYEEGWLVRVRLSDKRELASLMSAEAYQAFISESET